MVNDYPHSAEVAPAVSTDKAVQLFTYLQELCALRTSQVRDVSQYDEVFWFGDIPRERLCHSIAWRIGQNSDDSGEERPDLWVEVHKPELKRHPEVPDELEQWLSDDLSDSSLEEPRLFSEIPVSMQQEEEGLPVRTEILRLDDFPEIFELWLDYVEGKWKPWAEEDRRLQRVQNAYNRLFAIYQRQEKLGEQYEVVVGVGLLSWQSPASGPIRRHVVCLQTRVEFDRLRGVMIVRAGSDGPQPVLECEMLDTEDRPEVTGMTALDAAVKELDGEPWGGPELEAALRMLANELSTESRYEGSLDRVTGYAPTPVLSLAPAVILRRRTRRTFVSFYEQMIEQMQAGGEVPDNVRRVVEIIEEGGNEEAEFPPEDTPHRATVDDVELYFPLPSNREQRRIAERVDQRRGVLVQGPPGTGKSHTIANLIAHFLARGKRVLVTSETPRALDVLRNMLPKEIRELCVVWLGSGKQSQHSLEQSVQGITQRKIQWNNTSESEAIQDLHAQLDKTRRSKRQLTEELRACREADTYRHDDVFGYCGTLQRIAIQVNDERQHFGWLTDRPASDSSPAVTGDELLLLLRIHRQLTAERVQEMGQSLVPLERLIDPKAFRNLVEDDHAALGQHHAAARRRSYLGYEALKGWDTDSRHELLQLLKQLVGSLDGLSRHYHAFADKAAKEIAGDQDRTWRELLQVTEGHVQRYAAGARELSGLQIAGIEDRDALVVAADARELKAHLDAGKRLGVGPFRAQVVKRALYLVKEVRVDGRTCESSETLGYLLQWLDLGRTLQELGELWRIHCTPPTGTYAVQLAAYLDLCEPLRDALAVHDYVQDIKGRLAHLPGLQHPHWHDRAEIEALCAAVEAADVEDRHRRARAAFAPLTTAVRESAGHADAHPTTASLLRAVEDRNVQDYSEAARQIGELHRAQREYREVCDILSRFKQCAPQTCAAYEVSVLDEAWDTRLSVFEKAWLWAQAEAWLVNMCDTETPRRLVRALEQSQQSERDTLKQLAACKAWQHCMDSLGEAERMALVAWKMAVNKIGRGTGKYAERHRETAREKLQECRRAIPAWVMPLYQVVQTIRPAPGIFDIVIVDEASQSGPEALFLNYIGKKLIVVGDDKQITPLHVGVNRQQVDYLRRMHLQGIPHSESLDLEGSLFAQAELRFPDRIRLREHFRCMPEIIQFSNNLSYSTEPLIPLRQYGNQRQEPVKTVHVADGYRKGKAGNVENRPEALAIVSRIAECCEDPEYNHPDGSTKSFGVISLLGHRQSALIASLLVKELGAEEMEKRQLICGEPYDFQGDERDVIFLSMVDAPEDGRGCRMVRDAATQRRFNVAASRARDQLWLFHSATLNDLRAECLCYRLLEYCLNPKPEQSGRVDAELAELQRLAEDPVERQHAAPPRPFDSWFEVDVYLRIVAKGYRALPQYEVAGYRIDLVVEGLRGRMAVECDGDEWHGPDRYNADMERQRELERCGWVFFRVLGSVFYRDPEEALAPLWQALERLGICPESDWRAQAEEISVAEASHDPKDFKEGVDVPIVPEGAEDVLESEQPQSSIGGIAEKVPADRDAGRLDRALDWSRRRQQRPEDLPPQEIQAAITTVLRDCPNHTCTLKSITSRVLRHFSIRTRGNPRADFEKRVMRNIGAMKRKGLIEEYQARNRRIRLLGNEEETLF